MRSQPAKVPPPTWLPKSTNGYVIMTCSQCLRPFSVPTEQVQLDETGREKCLHCGQGVTYYIDTTVTAPEVIPQSILRESTTRIKSARAELQEVKITAAERTTNGQARNAPHR